MQVVARAWLVIFVFVFALGCTQGFDPPDPSVENGASTPPTVADGRAAAKIDAPSSIRAPRSPVVLSATFEDASAQCNDWSTDAAIGIRAIPPHSGDYACKVCATGEAAAAVLRDATGPIAAGRYALVAWMRNRPGTPGPAYARAILETDGASASTTTALDESAWARVELTIDVPAAAPELRVRFDADTAPGACMFVDDVVVSAR